METELRTRLEVLETDAAQHQAVVDSLTRKYMDTIEKLQNDKAKLEVRSFLLLASSKSFEMKCLAVSVLTL